MVGERMGILRLKKFKVGVLGVELIKQDQYASVTFLSEIQVENYSLFSEDN